MSAADNVISKSSPMAKQSFYRLVIDTSGAETMEAVSMNKPLAEKLLKVRPRMRSLQMEKCFLNVLKQLPENAVVKDVDVLKVLISAYKQRPFKLIWSGTFKDGKLIYSEEGYPDYKTYDVSEYDIICIQ